MTVSVTHISNYEKKQILVWVWGENSRIQTAGHCCWAALFSGRRHIDWWSYSMLLLLLHYSLVHNIGGLLTANPLYPLCTWTSSTGPLVCYTRAPHLDKNFLLEKKNCSAPCWTWCTSHWCTRKIGASIDEPSCKVLMQSKVQIITAKH